MKAVLPEERPVYVLAMRPSNIASSWRPNSLSSPTEFGTKAPTSLETTTCGRVTSESVVLRVELVSEVDTVQDVGRRDREAS